jgi:hypothetical protein
MKGIQKNVKKSFKEIRYVQFGNFILNHYQLSNHNILLIKYPKTLAPVPKLKRTIVSDNMKMFLEDLISNQRINTTLQKQIISEEIKLLEKLLLMAGLIVSLNYNKYDRTIEDSYLRYQLLVGGMSAGNQSEEVRIELITILKLFMKKQAIDNEEGLELILTLS